MGRSLEELETMFTEGKSIRAIVKESRKPFKGGLEQRVREKEAGGEEDEYVA